MARLPQSGGSPATFENEQDFDRLRHVVSETVEWWGYSQPACDEQITHLLGAGQRDASDPHTWLEIRLKFATQETLTDRPQDWWVGLEPRVRAAVEQFDLTLEGQSLSLVRHLEHHEILPLS